MRFVSVCSGIEAASVAFEPLGWKALVLSEIEAFPVQVLKHRQGAHDARLSNRKPGAPLLWGDFTSIRERFLRRAGITLADADMLCGGTPRQAFSVAGNRQSLADDRGNLTLQFVLLANAIDAVRRAAGREPAWILWENVPGVLSTNDNAFGAFLGGLVGRDAPIPEPEGGWTRAGVVDGPTRCAAWRILDAQHFGLAQRRQRVFVLARGGAGRWAVADALLPIIESSRWHPAPRQGKGEGVAGTISARTSGGGALRTDFECGGGLQVAHVPPVSGTLVARSSRGKGQTNSPGHNADEMLVAHTLRAEGFDASEDGTGRGIPLVMSHGQANAEIVSDGEPSLTCNHEAPIVAQFLHVNKGRPDGRKSDHVPMVSVKDHVPTLTTDGHQQSAICVRMREGKEGGGKGPLVSEDQSLTLATANDQVLAYAADTVTAKWSKGAEALQQGAQTGGNCIPVGMQVRRLTPVETSRLQGFPDTYCHIPTSKRRKIPADEADYLQGHGLNCWQVGEQWFTDTPADGPIYKAHGNSWAVNCVRWIGEQIERVRKAEPT